MMTMYLAVIFILPIIRPVNSVSYRPVVIMHGVLSSAEKMNDLASWIRQSYEGIYVNTMEIGNGYDDSLLLPMNQQVTVFCQNVIADPQLKQGFSLIGVSQGGLIVRAAVERCSLPVYNLITLVGPHEDIFGVPDLQMLPEEFRQLVSKYAYEESVQNTLSVAGYWRDPYQLEKYVGRCQFLPDINNEKTTRNETYRLNVMKLNSFVIVYSDIDDIVSPPQSAWFLGYQTNSLEVQTFNQSRQFTEDLIGLGTLLKQERLYLFTSHTKHRDSAHQPK